MIELLTAIISTLAALGPVAALGWLLAIGLGYLYRKEIAGRRADEAALRDRIEELRKLHYEAVLAERDGRIADLKEINSQYDATMQQIAKSLAALTRKTHEKKQ